MMADDQTINCLDNRHFINSLDNNRQFTKKKNIAPFCSKLSNVEPAAAAAAELSSSSDALNICWTPFSPRAHVYNSQPRLARAQLMNYTSRRGRPGPSWWFRRVVQAMLPVWTGDWKSCTIDYYYYYLLLSHILFLKTTPDRLISTRPRDTQWPRSR